MYQKSWAPSCVKQIQNGFLSCSHKQALTNMSQMSPVLSMSEQDTGTSASSISWMQTPQTTSNCPPGLEYLTPLDCLLINRGFDSLGVCGPRSSARRGRFAVTNCAGQGIYTAIEHWGWFRGMKGVRLFDSSNNEIIHLRLLPYRCFTTVEVTAPPLEVVIGRIEKRMFMCTQNYIVKNCEGKRILMIRGPCDNVAFKILSADGRNLVGKISKHWQDLTGDMFKCGEYFGISFPADLDVRSKALLLASCFIINNEFYQFERSYYHAIASTATAVTIHDAWKLGHMLKNLGKIYNKSQLRAKTCFFDRQKMLQILDVA